jgi:hypothetical protein
LSSFSFDIDPQAVLGVPADATLEQIRDAYRQKCKTFHPDAGGEEWAFRVLVQSYEMLSTARVLRATRAEPVRGQGATAPAAARHHDPSAETLRGGLHDQNVPLERIVGVEHLCVRYLWDDAAYLWLTQKQSEEERFLSCSLNLSWPDQGQAATASAGKEATRIVLALNEIFDHMIVSTRVITSRSHSDDDEFAGWLSYSSFDRSWKALKCLHDAVRSRGLGLRQWSRDLFIPKNWGDRPVR